MRTQLLLRSCRRTEDFGKIDSYGHRRTFLPLLFHRVIVVRQSLSEAFFRDGAVVIRNALDPDIMALLRRVYDFALDNPTHPSPQMFPDADAIKAKNRKGGSVAIAKRMELAEANKNDYDSGTGRNFSMNINLNLRTNEEYNKLVAHPELLRAAESLWGYKTRETERSQQTTQNPAIYYVGEQLFIKEGNAAPVTWHTDTADLPMAGRDLVTLWIPLEPTTRALGRDSSFPQTLEFVKGSHQGFIRPDDRTIEGRTEISNMVYDSAYGPNKGLAPLDVEAARSDSERIQGTQGTAANILSFDTQPGDIVAFHWATFHGGGATPPGVKRRTVALRYVGPRCFMSPRSTNSTGERMRWLKSKIHPFEGPEPAFQLIPFFGEEENESPTSSGITYGDRLQ